MMYALAQLCRNLFYRMTIFKDNYFYRNIVCIPFRFKIRLFRISIIRLNRPIPYSHHPFGQALIYQINLAMIRRKILRIPGKNPAIDNIRETIQALVPCDANNNLAKRCICHT